MKTLIKILCLSVLWFSCAREDVYGCTDQNACNFNSNANIYTPNSCIYEVDCNGDCGGNALLDNCNVCDNYITNDCEQDICGIWGGTSLPDCAGDCNKNVELWEECYNIEETTWLVLGADYYTWKVGDLTGEIPSDIGKLTNLTHLALGLNKLTGPIPSEIGNLTKLDYLDLSNNQLTGQIPNEIGNLTRLDELKLENNKIIGEIPSKIGQLINLERLNLTYNQLTGIIPAEIGNLKRLTFLGLYKNQLTGTIPAEIGYLTRLDYLGLFDNQLTGEIPSAIGNLKRLTMLMLSNNKLTGTIPSEIGNLINLKFLRLDNNQLTGEVPKEICELNPSTSNNQLCPPYPDCSDGPITKEYNQDTSNCP